MSNVRLPRLLDSDLNEIARLHPSQLTVTLNLTPLSTASMILPEGEPSIGLRQYVELYGMDGSLGIFRVSSVGTEYGNEQEVMLEHAIVSLEDDLTDEEATLSGSMTDILKAILNKQTEKKWTLGTVELAGGGHKLEVDRHNLLEALLDAVKLADGYALNLDQSAVPWRIHLYKLPTKPGCECRMHRNISNIKITIDDQNLCTRVYSSELPNGYMEADTAGTWGIVAKTANIPAGASDDDATKYAKAYLADNKNPNVAIEIDAVELSKLTGEPLDAFQLGNLCRAALPEWGIVKDERLISIRYTDIISNPEQVRLTLSKPARDLAHLVASNRKASGGAGSSANKAWQHIFDTEESVLILHERIELITATTDALTGAVSSAEIRLNAAEASLNLKVSWDGIISAINMSPEAIVISSKKINLDGYVTASKLSADLAALDVSLANYISTSKLSADTVECTKLLVTDAEFKAKTIRYMDASGNAASMVVLCA